MEKYNKIYKALSITYFVIHICVLLYVVIVGFLPYQDEKNFYQSWGNEYQIIAQLVIGCICAYFAIKRPAMSILVAIVDTTCFVLYTLALVLVAIANKLGDGDKPVYHSGYYMMWYACEVIVLDFVFAIYAIVTIFLRKIHKSKVKQTDMSLY